MIKTVIMNFAMQIKQCFSTLIRLIFEYVENSPYNGIIILNKQNHHIFQQDYRLKTISLQALHYPYF